MGLLLTLRKDTNVRSCLSRPIEEALYTVAVLKKTNHANISSLGHRIVCQKIIYFANRLGISPKYNFNLYVRGPYSHELAKDLYALEKYFSDVIPADFISNKTAEKFGKLLEILNGESGVERKLEIAATLDYFYLAFGTKEKAAEKTKEVKSATDDEIVLAKNNLATIGVW